MPSFTPPVLKGLLKKPGRHPDGQAKGLYFRVVGDGKPTGSTGSASPA